VDTGGFSKYFMLYRQQIAQADIIIVVVDSTTKNVRGQAIKMISAISAHKGNMNTVHVKS